MSNLESPKNEEPKCENGHGSPCLELNCSWCCNPVKIPYRKNYNVGMPPILDKNGNEIWTDRGEVLAPIDHIETVRVKTFDCNNYNKETGLCDDYENRPDICRNTSCIDKDSDMSAEEQQKKLINESFIKLK